MATLYVAAGGMLGVLARFGIGRLTLHHEALIWSTVAINIPGRSCSVCWPRNTGSAVICAKASASASSAASRRSQRSRCKP